MVRHDRITNDNFRERGWVAFIVKKWWKLALVFWACKEKTGIFFSKKSRLDEGWSNA